MSGQPASMPSWQSTQRMGSGGPAGTPPYSSQSPPTSYRGMPSSSSDYPSISSHQPSQSLPQQAFPGSQARFRPSTGTGSGSSSSGGMNRSNSYVTGGGNGSNGGTPPATAGRENGSGMAWPQQQGGAGDEETDRPQSQQQVHRRTQSLRPMSAFQPLENVEGPYPGAGPRPPSPTGSTSRSIRTAAAPLTFKSPELRSALSLQEAQSKKIYMEGYLSKRDHLTPDGKPLPPTDPKKRWQLCFVQLCGTVLSIWGVHQMEAAARQGREVPPAYVNVTDCFVDFIGTITESPQDVPGSRGRYENVFAINTAGQNRILFGVEGNVGRRLVQAWVNGIRLATWEKIRLEEIYTGSLVRARLGAVSAQQATSGPGGAPGDVEMSIKSPLGKNGRMEGWVKARFMGSTEWRKCWLVLTDRGAESASSSADNKSDAKSETGSVTSNRNSFWSKLRSGDRSSIIGAPSTPAVNDTGVKDIEVPPGSNGATGLACFFENKKGKKPFATLAYAAHTFAVYPSRPELVEGSSLFKVEGAFPLSGFVSATNRIRQTGWVMIMPELEGGSKGANAEMMKWCIAFMDAFKLYGRPAQFQWDARSPLSPFFAYPIGPYKDRLFLDRELSEFLDIREERHLGNRNNLHGIMAARMRGERTPILPPLPQPNVESTRGLNGPGGAGQTSQPGQPQQEPASRSELPPLNIDGDNTFSSRSGPLSAIGERSREGSMMTALSPTPNTPSTDNALNGRDESPATAKPSTTTLQSAPVTRDASHTTQASESAQTVTKEKDSSSISAPVQQQPVLAPVNVSKAPTQTATPPPPAPPKDSTAATKVEATPAQASGKPKGPARNDSDPMTSFDEGALYYINSIGEQLPTVSPKNPSRQLRPSSKEGSAPGSIRGVTEPAAGAAAAKSSADSGLNGAGANGTAVPLQSQNVDNLDSDARAAYSFLDRPPSPPVSSSSNSRPGTSTAAGSVTAGSQPAEPPLSYPSSFSSNKRAQERKLAAQAQAQAHSDAISKPGRGGKPKKSRLGGGSRQAWGDDDDDEEEEEEEDDDEEDNPRAGTRPVQATGLPTQPAPQQQGRGSMLPSQMQSRGSYASHLAPQAITDSRGSSPGGSFDSMPRSNTLVQLSREEQPGAITTAFQSHGLVQLSEQEKAERSAKQQEADARAMGGHFVNVDSKPPPPQAGLVGAISAHERDRRKEGGLAATLTERDRERRQREEEAMRAQNAMMLQQQQQQQAFGQGSAPPPGWGGMPAFNPMMWQQMQMMSMMNPMMFGGAPPPGAPNTPGSGSQSGHGVPSAEMQAQQAAQMRAAQAAQQAYMQAMQQGGGGAGGASNGSNGPVNGSAMPGLPSSPSMPPMSMGMMPFNPYMSMYGPPMGFPGWGHNTAPGSDMSGHGGMYQPGMTASPTGTFGSPPLHPQQVPPQSVSPQPYGQYAQQQQQQQQVDQRNRNQSSSPMHR